MTELMVNLNTHGTYVTGNLCNQALHVMSEHFSHFAKFLNKYLNFEISSS